MSDRNTKRVDENRTVRRDLTMSASAKKPAFSQAINSKDRNANKRKPNNTKIAKIAKVAKVAKIAKIEKVAKVIKRESAYLTEVNAVSFGNKSVSDKAAKRKTLLGKSSLKKPGTKKLVSEHSELAMRAAKRIKASKNKRKTSHLVCRHLCMMLNSPISPLEPTFRPVRLAHSAIAANESLGQCFLPI